MRIMIPPLNYARMEIFEGVFDQYGTSNSGLDDNLRDLMIDLCSTP